MKKVMAATALSRVAGTWDIAFRGLNQCRTVGQAVSTI